MDLQYPEPTLLCVRASLPTGEGWLDEPKWDASARCSGGDRPGAAVISRSGKDLSARYPELLGAATALLPVGTIIDGEILCVR